MAQAQLTKEAPLPAWRAHLRLIIALVKRDIRSGYRRSILGPLWAIIPPVMTMLVFALLRGLFGISSEGVPQVLFLFSAILPWTYFTNIVTGATPGVLSNASLLKKLPIPREIFTLIGVFSAIFDLVIASSVLLVMMIWFQTPITPALLWIPILLLIITLLGWTIGMAVSSVGVYRRDFLKATPFLMQFWFFVTPVIYPLSQVHERLNEHLLPLYQINPMVGVIEGFRSIIIYGEPPDLGLVSLSVITSIVLFIIVLPIFRMMSRYFADVL